MTIFLRKSLPVILSLSVMIAFYAIFGIYERDYKTTDRHDLIKSDHESIARGRNIFNSKCSFCHDAHSSETLVGPGLKGIFKTERLPFSKRYSTPENIMGQLKKPLGTMPAFDYLTEEETMDILSYLYTL